MKTLDGWQRLVVVLTMLWLGGVMLFTAYEYSVVAAGESPIQFVVLRDTDTNMEFGGLSTAEIKELGELTLKKSLSAESEPGDAVEAESLLGAQPIPKIRYYRVAIWLLLPLVFLWVLFGAVRWIAAGFRRA